RDEIMRHPDQIEYTKKGWTPLFDASAHSKIPIIGQAPGIKTQEKHIAWQDLSGMRHRQWLGVDEKTFYVSTIFAEIPMDFYLPGKAKTGDKPPRKDFAAMWHPKILALLKDVQLIILIRNYSQKYYLGENAKKNLTETVASYQS